jgi:hypothetical protein
MDDERYRIWVSGQKMPFTPWFCLGFIRNYERCVASSDANCFTQTRKEEPYVNHDVFQVSAYRYPCYRSIISFSGHKRHFMMR